MARKVDRRRVRTGDHFMQGDRACAEGAVAAGCRVFAGYPITPASEIAEQMSERLPAVGGHYIQMEDEIASMNAILGASNTGVRSMTATSGPGFSLMMENYGLGLMTETPTVIVNVMRGGPSTGMPTLMAQGDVMQSRWGSHGDYEPIVVAPASVQEMFDLTIHAFNVSDRYRVPVTVLSDQIIGHMTGLLHIPAEEDVPHWGRPRPTEEPSPDFLPFKGGENGVPPMGFAGEGYRLHVTGLTHDERGYPSITPDAQKPLMDRLMGKIRNNIDDIVMVEEYMLEDAEIGVIAFGSNSTAAAEGIRRARAEGIRVGMLRFMTIWPFAEKHVRDLSQHVDWILVPEINYGQLVHPVREFAECPVRLLPHAGGHIHPPNDILTALREGLNP